MLLSIGVGIFAGLGAILFDRLLGWTLHAILGTFTGYIEPQAGSSAASLFTFAPVRSPWFFIIPALGGLVSGVIVYLIAPELPVARAESPDEIVGMISKRDIVDYYYGRSML